MLKDSCPGQLGPYHTFLTLLPVMDTLKWLTIWPLLAHTQLLNQREGDQYCEYRMKVLEHLFPSYSRKILSLVYWVSGLTWYRLIISLSFSSIFQRLNLHGCTSLLCLLLSGCSGYLIN